MIIEGRVILGDVVNRQDGDLVHVLTSVQRLRRQYPDHLELVTLELNGLAKGIYPLTKELLGHGGADDDYLGLGLVLLLSVEAALLHVPRTEPLEVLVSAQDHPGDRLIQPLGLER
jgi:hypothetical protein